MSHPDVLPEQGDITVRYRALRAAVEAAWAFHRSGEGGEGSTLLVAGERVGLIRFGSRCDVYLPPGVEPSVLLGQRTVAGETILADLVGTQVRREGRAS